MMKIIIIFLLALIISSCSNRGAYEGIQASNRFECTKQPPNQYDDCMERTNKPYNQYKKERQQTLEGKGKL